LNPDTEAVKGLAESLDKAKMGVVAHYYMDVELQGVLQAVGQVQAMCQSTIPDDTLRMQDINKMCSRVAIADSLAMGDHAVRMCRDGVTSIACLGVDFMAESVAAILEHNGFGHIPVYRATSRAIGCSLAESAERQSYRAWLEMASRSEKPALHVVYINTSLETKAVSSTLIPTITCTSSNVLKTLLQASAQIGPELQIYYGPDTYMGENLVSMLDSIILYGWDDERISSELHPMHNRQSLQQLRDNIHVYPNGNCVVHHMFGSDVVQVVRQRYQDSFITAHLEVPGEMFQIAMEKSLEGKGIVGSTSDILHFISKKVEEAAVEDRQIHGSTGSKRRLRFVLGTEAGMVTSIVRSVQRILSDNSSTHIEAEIIFPVASEAVTTVEGDETLSIVPGVSGGEGCSTAGGCATCPFMKMNNLDSLTDVLSMVNQTPDSLILQGHLPPQRLKGKLLNGKSATELGSEPIQYMRHFMKEKALPEALVQRVRKCFTN
jgi:quinolinate synthase